MTAAIAAGRRFLPRGYADFGLQVVIWFGFLLAYQIARGLADRDPSRAFENGWRVIDIEQRLTGLGELTLQGWTQSSHFLAELVSWTYWNSEFTVIGLALLWVYLRRNEAFTRFRNTILLANGLGLIGYVLLPTAPPRFFTSIGFEDTLGQFGGPQPRQRVGGARSEPVCGDAEPPRSGRSDRRRRARVRRRATGPSRCSGCSGRCGCGSPSWRRATTSGSTCSQASCSARSPSRSSTAGGSVASSHAAIDSS